MKENQLITIKVNNIKSAAGETLSYQSCFTTQMFPMLSAISRIQQEIGSYLEGIGEDITNQLILRYSNEIFTITVCDTSESRWQLLAQNWVTYNTAIDILYNSPSYRSETSGKVYKKLGDFAISKDSGDESSSPLTDLIKKLECELYKIDMATRTGSPILPTCEILDKDLLAQQLVNRRASHSVVKGEFDPNRPTMGRSFVFNGKSPRITHVVDYHRRKYFLNSGEF